MPRKSPRKSSLSSFFMALAISGQSPSFDVRNCQREHIYGDWQFTGLIYKDRQWPPPNKNLDLRFAFHQNGQSELKWTRRDTHGQCRRSGVFLYDQCTLVELVVSVDPNNSMECRNDPDMQLRRQTFTRMEVTATRMRLHLKLGDEPLIYLWTRAPESSTVTKTGR